MINVVKTITREQSLPMSDVEDQGFVVGGSFRRN